MESVAEAGVAAWCVLRCEVTHKAKCLQILMNDRKHGTTQLVFCAVTGAEDKFRHICMADGEKRYVQHNHLLDHRRKSERDSETEIQTDWRRR